MAELDIYPSSLLTDHGFVQIPTLRKNDPIPISGVNQSQRLAKDSPGPSLPCHCFYMAWS